jgi:protein gp37
MGKTTIAWTDYTYNEWWGCSKVSEGCRLCYAETLSSRFGNDVWGVTKPRKFFDASHRNQLKSWNDKAYKAGTFARVFIGSMMDIFEIHQDSSVRKTMDEHRDSLLKSLPEYKNLVFLLLTKRIENAVEVIPQEWINWTDFNSSWPKNVRIGCSIENNKRFDERINYLLQFPYTFISFEPLLEEIAQERIRAAFSVMDNGWAIVGGESGHNARPFRPEWITPFVDWGAFNLVPVFVKQMGTYWASATNSKSKKGEDMSEWHPSHQVRQFPIEPRELTNTEKAKTLVEIFK